MAQVMGTTDFIARYEIDQASALIALSCKIATLINYHLKNV